MEICNCRSLEYLLNLLYSLFVVIRCSAFSYIQIRSILYELFINIFCCHEMSLAIVNKTALSYVAQLFYTFINIWYELFVNIFFYEMSPGNVIRPALYYDNCQLLSSSCDFLVFLDLACCTYICYLIWRWLLSMVNPDIGSNNVTLMYWYHK